MLIRYVLRLRKPIILEDHWPIPFMGGELRMVSKDGKIVGVEVVFENQPVKYAPTIAYDPGAKIKTSITGHDERIPFVRFQLQSAFAFLQCYFDIEIVTDEVEVEFEADTEEEKDHIAVSAMTVGKADRPLSISFDFITRAIMAAEKSGGPQFEATLVLAARRAMLQEKFIDSFRYSFLLIEAVFGDGKFKTAQLKDALKASTQFVAMVASALKPQLLVKRVRGSDTEALLATSPTPDVIIDHLVEKRGFYFHGNVKGKDAWKPHDQNKAEALAAITLEIAMLISHKAAAPMFEDELAKRHFENAKKAGAIMSLNVEFKFREPDEDYDRNGNMTISAPGTKITPKIARQVAQQFLARFENGAPVAALKTATCTLQETGEKVFEMTFAGE